MAESNVSELGTPTGIKTGCMKWYAYKEDTENYTMILDHNTTVIVAWNPSGNNSSGMTQVKDALERDTEGWKQTARLITADEIAEITGAKEKLKWDSSKTSGNDDIETKVSFFYLDGAGTTYSKTDGWQKQVAKTQGASKYAWLYDNLNNCTSYGCNIADDKYSENNGSGFMASPISYWTSTPTVGDSTSSWVVSREGALTAKAVGNGNGHGVRPVITIAKSIIN